MNSIYDILDQIQERGGLPEEYHKKQIHKVPEAEVVNRAEFLIERCKGKVVLDIGCASGELHGKLAEVADRICGIDKEECQYPTAARFDVDEINGKPMPFADLPIEVIVCGELIEHLTNPGWFLSRLATTWPKAEVVITTPNAFSESGRAWMKRGIENVNAAHTMWFSWHTLTQLVERSGYEISRFYWYNGKPLLAEGLVFVLKTGADTVGSHQRLSPQLKGSCDDAEDLTRI